MEQDVVLMQAKLIGIVTVKEGVVKTNHLDSYQQEAYRRNSKAIRKVNDKMYLDFSDSYTATYLKYEVRGVVFKTDIRNILKKVTGKKRFTDKFLSKLYHNMPATLVVSCNRKSKRIWLNDLESVISQAYSKIK